MFGNVFFTALAFFIAIIAFGLGLFAVSQTKQPIKETQYIQTVKEVAPTVAASPSASVSPKAASHSGVIKK